MSSDFSGLENFRNKLLRLQKINKGDLAKDIAESGASIAREKYLSAAVTVSTEQKGNGARIIAQGEQVAFMEYGTGHQGAFSGYEGNLPSQTLHFESPKGTPQSTLGWQYNYDNPQTKVEKNGEIGWYYGGSFTTGQPAQAQMWKTALELRKKGAAQLVKEYLEKVGV